MSGCDRLLFLDSRSVSLNTPVLLNQNPPKNDKFLDHTVTIELSISIGLKEPGIWSHTVAIELSISFGLKEPGIWSHSMTIELSIYIGLKEADIWSQP